MKMFKQVFMVGVSLFALLGLQACEQESTFEETGESIDQGVDNTQDTLGEGVDNTSDAIDNAGNEVDQQF